MDNSLWDGTSDCDKPLRRPNLNSAVDSEMKQKSEEQNFTENSQLPTQSNNHHTDIVKDSNKVNGTPQKSCLNADAKEWFPANYTSPQLAQPAQSRLQRIKHEYVTPEDSDLETSENTIGFSPIQLDILIKALIYDPGQFDNLVENFMIILSPHFGNVDVATKTAEVIFEYALKEPSFRYNAARLFSVLDAHYPLLRAQLHMLCHKALQLDKQHQGLTLFLAELFMQLHYEAVYGGCVIDSLKKLVSSNGSEDIKSACQALKVCSTRQYFNTQLMCNQLAGHSLESSNRKALDEIFQNLEATKPNLPQSLVNLVDSVITLRSNNWGRTTIPIINNNSSQEQNGVITSSSDEEFVLYGPDGQEITQEEQEFFYSNFGDDGDYLGDESSDPDELYNPEPEMDEEIQEAFREFVKLSKR